MKQFVNNYRIATSSVVGEYYAQLASDELRRAIWGLLGAVAIIAIDLVLAMTTPIANSVIGTLGGVAIAVSAVAVLFVFGARWNSVSYRIRGDLRAAGYSVRQPADIRGAGTLANWLRREGLTPEQVIAVGARQGG